MKKTHKHIKYLSLLICIMCLFVFNSGCGLDTIYMIDPPYSVSNRPYTSNTIDYSTMYFEFWTNESDASSGFTPLGTEIYYKIYNNESTLNSEVSVLTTLANDSEKQANSADKLINPTSSGGYGYKTLKLSGNYDSPLIYHIGSNQLVHIRLTDYPYNDKWYATVMIGDNRDDMYYINGSKENSRPVRNVSERYSFNFWQTGSSDKKPLAADDDTTFSTDITDDVWYVSMFAVATGRDSTYRTYYSNILYLGAVTIKDPSL